MENRFDELAKALAGGLSRRTALQRVAVILAGGLLAAAGLTARRQACADEGDNCQCRADCARELAEALDEAGGNDGGCDCAKAAAARQEFDTCWANCGTCTPALPCVCCDWICNGTTVGVCEPNAAGACKNPPLPQGCKINMVIEGGCSPPCQGNCQH